MFRALIATIFRNTRLCVTACGIMHPRYCRPVTGKRRNSASTLPAGVMPVHYTTSCNKQSSAPEYGRDQRPKHVELIGIINKPLLLHLFGVYIIYKGKLLWRIIATIISRIPCRPVWHLNTLRINNVKIGRFACYFARVRNIVCHIKNIQ